MTRVLGRAGRFKIAWRPDRTWECPACRAWLIDRDVAHYLDVIGPTPVTTITITSSAWKTRQQALRRGGYEALRIPQSGDLVVVVTTSPEGTPIADLRGLLASTIAAKPPGKRISSTRAWTLKAAMPERPYDWQLIGLIRFTPIGQVVEVAQQHGLYLRRLPAYHEEHELTGLTSRFVLAVGMRRIDGGTSRRWETAA